MHGRTVAPENPEIRDLLFVARGFESVTWRANGLSYALVGDVPRSDLEALRARF
jgi:anti-sigma factor RsiW